MSRFLFMILILSVVFSLEAAHSFAVYGVNPNLILIILLAFLFGSSKKSEGVPGYFVLLISFLVLWFFWFGFWLTPALILAGLIVAAGIVKRFLTGRDFTDFYLGLVIITACFYLISAWFGISNLSLTIVGFEILYNLVLGALLWFPTKKLMKIYA